MVVTLRKNRACRLKHMDIKDLRDKSVFAGIPMSTDSTCCGPAGPRSIGVYPWFASLQNLRHGRYLNLLYQTGHVVCPAQARDAMQQRCRSGCDTESECFG